MPIGKSKSLSRGGKILTAILMAIFLIAGLLLAEISSWVPDVQAQTATGTGSLGTFLDGATEAVQGGYQTANRAQPQNPTNQTQIQGSTDYALWKYRSIQGSTDYDRWNRCDAPDYDGTINKKTIYVGMYPHGHSQEVDDCVSNPNEPNLEDNLKHNWNKSGLNIQTLKAMQPFLVIGTTSSGGFDSPSLQLDAWIPLEATSFTIKASELCTPDMWDTHALGRGKITITAEGSQKVHYPCNRTVFNFQINQLGNPLDTQTLTTIENNQAKDHNYQLYKLTVAIEQVMGQPADYTNQFRLKVTKTQKGNTMLSEAGYLGIAKTNTGGNNPNNALGVGMRLPGAGLPADPGDFKRLQILWEIKLYAAMNPEDGCSSGKAVASVGLYDHDYSSTQNGAQAWMRYRYPPSLQIDSIDRNAFLSGTASWDTPSDVNTVKTLYFNDQSKANNLWDQQPLEFDGKQIYRFHFYNLDQKSWMQIGLPFAQSNALRKCIGKPLVKVYHGDVSVGGDFGTGTTGKACLNDKLGIPPRVPAAIYAHAKKGTEGSYGSSAEYAVYARGEIDAFYSKFKRNQNPLPDPIQQLTFANDPTDTWGGNWGGQLRCMPNYWREADKLVPDTSTETNLAELPQNTKQLYTLGQNQFTIKNTKPPPPTNSPNLSSLNLKTTLYVEGDVRIVNDIINENKDLTTLNQINLIYIIVKGDIFINHSVAQIDAVLIAMPKDDKKGRIYTCYIDNLNDLNASTDLHTQKKVDDPTIVDNQTYDGSCREKLTVNGALIARQVHLGRVTQPATGAVPERTVTEEINLLPEYFIGSPQLPAHTDWFYKSDSITILPTNF